MRKQMLLVATAAMMLAACETSSVRVFQVDGGRYRVASKPTATAVEVWVEGGRIVINQEPIYAQDDPDTAQLPTSDPQKKKKVTWFLMEPGFEFPQRAEEAIQFCTGNKSCATQPVDMRCNTTHGRTRLTCTYRWAPRNTQYFYAITVLDGSSKLVLDPSVMN